MHPTIEARELVAKWMIEHGYATGHGDTVEDLLGELAAGARDRAAKLMESLVTERPYSEQPWARMTAAIAARSIRRGRHLTDREKLLNLAAAMEEDDVDASMRDVAARLREIAGPEAR